MTAIIVTPIGRFKGVAAAEGLRSDIAFFLPHVPIGAGGLEHGFGGVVQPLWFLFGDVAEDCFAGGWSAEMNVGGFPSHGVEQAELGIGGAKGCEFDARAERAETAHDPASAKLDEGIGAADGAIDDGLVEDFGGAFDLGAVFSGLFLLNIWALSPVRGRWNESFGFASDAASMPVGDGDVSGVAEAAESGSAVSEAELDSGFRH